jgi:hypothetical protein
MPSSPLIAARPEELTEAADRDGSSLAELSRRSGLPRSTVGNILLRARQARGTPAPEWPTVELENAVKLAAALHRSTGDLFGAIDLGVSL